MKAGVPRLPKSVPVVIQRAIRALSLDRSTSSTATPTTSTVSGLVTIEGIKTLIGNVIGRVTGDVTGSAGSAATVTSNIGNHAITDIFESDGTTVKLSTESENAIGYNQTRSNVTSSRAINGTSYTNSTGRPIEVTIYVSNSTTSNVTLSTTVGGVTTSITIPNSAAANTVYITRTFIVLDGESYSASGTNASLQSWYELR